MTGKPLEPLFPSIWTSKMKTLMVRCFETELLSVFPSFWGTSVFQRDFVAYRTWVNQRHERCCNLSPVRFRHVMTECIKFELALHQDSYPRSWSLYLTAILYRVLRVLAALRSLQARHCVKWSAKDSGHVVLTPLWGEETLGACDVSQVISVKIRNFAIYPPSAFNMTSVKDSENRRCA